MMFKSNNGKSQPSEIKNSMASAIFHSLAETSSEFLEGHARELLQEYSKDIMVSTGLDFVSGLIPGIGSAINSFKMRKAIKNVEVALNEIKKQQDSFTIAMEQMQNDQKEKFDELFSLVFSKIVNETQEDKIKLFINGLLHSANNNMELLDITYLYLDTLDNLMMVDLILLRSYVPHYLVEGTIDLGESYEMDFNQRKKVREKLLNNGLLENKYDDELEKDLENIIKRLDELSKSVAETQQFLNSKRRKFTETKRTSSKSKIKAKDKYYISGFGLQFVEFCLQHQKQKRTN